MESDRMGYLLPALTEAKFSNQREVVLNERRQNYENRPYGLAGMAIVSALYPPDHPYHWLTIGGGRRHPRRPHRRRARVLPDATTIPANASLALAGDIDPETGSRSPSEYFGEIPGGEKPGAASTVTAPDAAGGGRQARARGSRRAAAPLPGVALAGALRRRRRRAGSGRRSAVERQDVAPLSRARLRAADRDRGRRLAELARARQLLPDRRHRRARAARWRKWSARSSKEIAGLDRSRPDGRRSSSAASRRRRRTSSSGCRPSAASAASRTS